MKVSADEGSGRNETGHRTNNETGEAVQSWL